MAMTHTPDKRRGPLSLGSGYYHTLSHAQHILALLSNRAQRAVKKLPEKRVKTFATSAGFSIRTE